MRTGLNTATNMDANILPSLTTTTNIPSHTTTTTNIPSRALGELGRRIQ